VDLRQGGDSAGGVCFAAVLEEHLERLVQLLDRVLGLPEQEVDPPKVVEEPADRSAVGDLLVLRLCLLGVLARQDPVALPLGDERSLEVGARDRARVVERFRELERALEVLACGLVVSLPAVAARSTAQNVGAQPVARET
jgi:hypothetical protein